MKPFRALARRGRLLRLTELAKKALGIYGLKDARLHFLRYGENAIYRLDVAGSGTPGDKAGAYIPNRFVLRVHAMLDAEKIAGELAWLAALSQDAGLPVPAPLLTPDGQRLATIATPGIPGGKVVSVMRWLDGRSPGKGLRPCHLAALGRVVARMHTFAAGWQPPAGFDRFHWDWETQLGGSLFGCPLDDLVASMPVRFREPFLQVSREARRAMDALGKGPQAYGMIHADLYPENVLFKAGQAYPIDFEDCGFGYYLWDIAVALCKWAWTEDWVPMRDAFRQGYAQIRPLPEAQWQQLDLFVATQFATMALWASAFLQHDPMRRAEYEPWRDENGEKLLEYCNRACHD